MLIHEILFDSIDLTERPASELECEKPAHALSASALASCKCQGFKARTGNKSHKIGNRRITVGGKRIKGDKCGGPLPDWS